MIDKHRVKIKFINKLRLIYLKNTNVIQFNNVEIIIPFACLILI